MIGMHVCSHLALQGAEHALPVQDLPARVLLLSVLVLFCRWNGRLLPPPRSVLC